MGVCNCSMFCCTLLYVHSSIAIILMGKRELIALLNLSSWCLVMVERLFLAVPRGCLQFVIVVFPDHTHLLFLRVLLLCAGDIELNQGPDSGNDSLLSNGSFDTSDIIKIIFVMSITMFKVWHVKLIYLNLSYQTLMPFPLLKHG